MDTPLIFKYFFVKISLSDAEDVLPYSIEGLVGLWEEQSVSHLPFKGLDVIRMKVPLQAGAVL
jgi:hypothetical protein